VVLIPAHEATSQLGFRSAATDDTGIARRVHCATASAIRKKFIPPCDSSGRLRWNRHPHSGIRAVLCTLVSAGPHLPTGHSALWRHPICIKYPADTIRPRLASRAVSPVGGVRLFFCGRVISRVRVFPICGSAQVWNNRSHHDASTFGRQSDLLARPNCRTPSLSALWQQIRLPVVRCRRFCNRAELANLLRGTHGDVAANKRANIRHCLK
jgi:hypothetical protein